MIDDSHSNLPWTLNRHETQMYISIENRKSPRLRRISFAGAVFMALNKIRARSDISTVRTSVGSCFFFHATTRVLLY
jgi:hypothetical protein